MQVVNAHQNNLKNISLEIPKNQLIVVTGLSGSGKSSLAMGTIANEGYRYFLESLPAYQQNSVIIPTAEVDDIQALPPVIKVEQSKRFQSTHATFGTLSDLASIFRIIFARYSAQESMSKSLFSFNNSKGACSTCRGIGEAEFIDINKLIGDENKTLREGAITTTLPNGYIVYSQVTVEELNKVCQVHGFTVDVPWNSLTPEQKEVILSGSERVKVFYGKHSLESRLRWDGIKAKPREEGYYKGILPIMSDILKRDRNPNILKFASAKKCPSCGGARIKSEHLKFKWQGKNFLEWMQLPLKLLENELKKLSLGTGEQKLVDQLLVALTDLIQLGMQEYTLQTPSSEISSGDAQRIKLVKQVNASLQGILYVFDEPSIGLPKSYQSYLRFILRRLIRAGNTVMVVEHDLDFIQSADWIVELGPGAGVQGGEIVFNGPTKEFLSSSKVDSPTLKAILETNILKKEAEPLTESDLALETGMLTVVSKKTNVIQKTIDKFCRSHSLSQTVVTDQAIGKTPRSNPATYTGLADKIRDLFAKTQAAKDLMLSKSHFSFNNKAGRCANCEGAGVITLSMSVMGEINQICPSCNGKRFKPEILKVSWKHKNIAQVYDLSIKEALDFFSGEKKILPILLLMDKLGLSYLKLGQPSNTLSGGEAQRIKLTKHFTKSAKNSLLILNEPSIGLHQQNVQQLLKALHQLKHEVAGIVCFENHTLFQQEADQWVENSPLSLRSAHELPAAVDASQINVEGARTHNLKDLSLQFPKNKLTVVTGRSGSGKSSLVIDTLHGFGLQEMTKQFSSYQQSRVGVNFQFEVDRIRGLTPTICVSRKEKSFTERSDVSKQTGIDKVLRFAFSRKAQFEGQDLSASHFSNNHELGKCAICEGFGVELLPDLDQMLKDPALSINEGVFLHNKAMAYYGQPGGQYMSVLAEVAKHHGFDLDTSFQDYTRDQKEIILEGAGELEWEADWKYKTKTRSGVQRVKMKWKGLNQYLLDEYYKTRKNKNIAQLTALLRPISCRNCLGSGLKAERLDFKIATKSIGELQSMTFTQLASWLSETTPQTDIDKKLKKKILEQLLQTVDRAKQLHIDYLQLNRRSNTLSGGENQRVSLIKQLNSPLKGVTYLLDEPSAGLSKQNISDLVDLLKELVSKGNTVIAIEHHKEILLAADHLVEIGPESGYAGGELLFTGTPKEFLKRSSTHAYLKSISSNFSLRSGVNSIELRKVSKHTLGRDRISLPVGGISAVSGPSGVGKTTLMKEVLIPSINQGRPIACEKIDLPKSYKAAHYFEPKKLTAQWTTLLVDYLDLLKPISQLFAKENGLDAKDFSYKNKKAQCDQCKGKGYLETSLDVTANAIEKCDVCKGTRYKWEVLSNEVMDKNIAQVLNLSIQELAVWLDAASLKTDHERTIDQLTQIGLAHLRLDQPVKSLSSGEKQRLLLRSWLQDQKTEELLVLDEPSIGLHFADIDLLFSMLQDLSKNNDLIVIDHNPYLLQKIGTGIELAE